MNYIDAIVDFWDKNGVDVESVPKLISKPLKEKIKCDAQELNFMKRTTRAKLPVWSCQLNLNWHTIVSKQC